MTEKPARHKVAAVVSDAGGRVVGKTRLQKVIFLLTLAGFEKGFRFQYHHFGPYSEDVSDAVRMAIAFDLLQEEVHTASWGGAYFEYTTSNVPADPSDSNRVAFTKAAAGIDSIELELAATAAYLAAAEKCQNPWVVTRRRKPEKATDERIVRAKAAYAALMNLDTPKPLPDIS